MIQEQKSKYIQNILFIMKFVAFHEIYMENIREQLCKDQQYNNMIAYKSIDHFNHNKLIPQQIYSFLCRNSYDCTLIECNEVLKATNKSAISLSYDQFLELTVCKNLIWKNLCLNRLSLMKVQCGTFTQLDRFRQRSLIKIYGLLTKQIQFIRQLETKKHQFIQEHSGDIYTFLQQFYEGKKQSLTYEQFFEKAYKYNCFVNQNQFAAMCKRSKKHFGEANAMLKENISWFIMTNSLSQKFKYGQKQNLSIYKTFQRQPCSYKQSIFQKKLNLQKQYSKTQIFLPQNKHKLKYPYYIPEQHFYPLPNQYSIREKQFDLLNDVQNMDDVQLKIRYQNAKRYYF